MRRERGAAHIFDKVAVVPEWRKKIEARSAADASQFRRLITNNKPLRGQVEILRHTFRLTWIPTEYLHSERYGETIDWWLNGHDEATLEAFEQAINGLLSTYRIPAKWHESVWHFVMFGKPTSGLLANTWSRRRLDDGTWETVVHDEAALEDPLLARILRDKSTPPTPRPEPNSRRLDWRPLWEWHKRHPEVTHAEIASLIGYHRVTVSRKFRDLDAEAEQQDAE